MSPPWGSWRPPETIDPWSPPCSGWWLWLRAAGVGEPRVRSSPDYPLRRLARTRGRRRGPALPVIAPVHRRDFVDPAARVSSRAARLLSTHRSWRELALHP